MIVTHRCAGEAGFERHMVEAGDVLPADALWYDLVEPTEGEDRKIEAILDVDVPTREEMRGIEPSSLLSVQDGTLFMAARLLCRSESAAPKLTDVSFILTPRALVTLRYDEPVTLLADSAERAEAIDEERAEAARARAERRLAGQPVEPGESINVLRARLALSRATIRLRVRRRRATGVPSMR